MVRLFRITEGDQNPQLPEQHDQAADQASSFPDESTEPGESMPTAMEVDESRRASLQDESRRVSFQEGPGELPPQPSSVEEEPGDVEMPRVSEDPMEMPVDPVPVAHVPEDIVRDVSTSGG